MKAVLLFSILALMAYGVCSNNLLDSIPQDIDLPALPIPKTRRTGSGRIVGGIQIDRNERKLFKYQVLLNFDNKSSCGGSIISERCIITAAHCTRDKSFGTVYIGVYDQSKISSDVQIIKITKKNWAQHPDYSQNPTINDLAIINLPEPIIFGEFVGPIEVECDDNERHENEAVRVSGWGKHSDSTHNKTTILRAAVVETAPSLICNHAYGRNRMLQSMICVHGTNTIGVCKGDSGGPIVSTKNGKLIGATSFGKSSCEQDKPRVFTRLSSFAKWIQDNTIDHIKNC